MTVDAPPEYSELPSYSEAQGHISVFEIHHQPHSFDVSIKKENNPNTVYYGHYRKSAATPSLVINFSYRFAWTFTFKEGGKHGHTVATLQPDSLFNLKFDGKEIHIKSVNNHFQWQYGNQEYVWTKGEPNRYNLKPLNSELIIAEYNSLSSTKIPGTVIIKERHGIADLILFTGVAIASKLNENVPMAAFNIMV
ncbi:hypothetical protein HK103_001103 [Boothiomyces macroporosus]|uniref:Uncharacterized protein n=1 Tax=Boothiomyces macroporosus TaxID=261099 RepID=A0AAD5Y130_9FUNG|nr:hypothetical protein HK103_001097 [Boothiomyces macroporosus]KAJ3252907.1 hypothetical protein HK103_001103 [Boothiomyces macroporosus]